MAESAPAPALVTGKDNLNINQEYFEILVQCLAENLNYEDKKADIAKFAEGNEDEVIKQFNRLADNLKVIADDLQATVDEKAQTEITKQFVAIQTEETKNALLKSLLTSSTETVTDIVIIDTDESKKELLKSLFESNKDLFKDFVIEQEVVKKDKPKREKKTIEIFIGDTEYTIESDGKKMLGNSFTKHSREEVEVIFKNNGIGEDSLNFRGKPKTDFIKTLNSTTDTAKV